MSRCARSGPCKQSNVRQQYHDDVGLFHAENMGASVAISSAKRKFHAVVIAPKPPLLPVLIDAGNISAKHAEVMFEEIASLGEASIRRIYGDFSGNGAQGWTKEKLAALAIVPHQQFANTTGKNASDIALVIDAMDILHSGRFDGFVLISSDSDFTRLASRIREQGVDVFGMGMRKTPAAFVKACKRFIYVENLTPEPTKTSQKPKPQKEEALVGAPAQLEDPSKLVKRAMDAINQDDEWFTLGRSVSISAPLHLILTPAAMANVNSAI